MLQPFLNLTAETWIPVLDGNESARHLFDRHYSRYRYADGRKPKLFVGPGEKMVLSTPCAMALFIWRKFISGDGQEGVNCAVFRNETDMRSSDLIMEADALADARWPGERHYTYADAGKIRSTNPGYCFQRAGWRKCGITKWNKLVILERPA